MFKKLGNILTDVLSIISFFSTNLLNFITLCVSSRGQVLALVCLKVLALVCLSEITRTVQLLTLREHMKGLLEGPKYRRLKFGRIG